MDLEHGHSPEEIARRVASPNERGHLRDAVLGGIDGAVTTFAIVAAVAGAELPHRIILILGIANVLADGVSMAASNWSGTKAEADDARRLREMEGRHIDVAPDGERAELRAILAAKGLEGETLEAATDAIASDRRVWIDMMMAAEHGVGEIDPKPGAAARATFLAFLAAGMVPLMPFFLGIANPFAWATAMTGVVFFGIGAAKSRWSLAPWWRSGLETFLIGGAAAGLAWGAGRLLESLGA